MASIRSASKHGKYHVSIRGSLSVHDLGRLERACGPALEERQPPLEIDLTRVTTIDEAARLFLQRLMSRGAIVSEV